MEASPPRPAARRGAHHLGAAPPHSDGRDGVKARGGGGAAGEATPSVLPRRLLPVHQDQLRQSQPVAGRRLIGGGRGGGGGGEGRGGRRAEGAARSLRLDVELECLPSAALTSRSAASSAASAHKLDSSEADAAPSHNAQKTRGGRNHASRIQFIEQRPTPLRPQPSPPVAPCPAFGNPICASPSRACDALGCSTTRSDSRSTA